MTAEAAGRFRRTPVERLDQRIAWQRPDQLFFAAGACHVLAWACREAFADKAIGTAAMRFAGEARVFHTYATWRDWAFDHSGWNLEVELIAANTEFEGRALERIEIIGELADFCAQHRHRMPDQFWRDPVPRARAYVKSYSPPWTERSSSYSNSTG